MKRNPILNLVLMSLVMVGCTKELPYEEEYKEDVHAKSLFGDEDYLFTISYADVSRSAELARPYWQGDERIVRFRFTKDTLQVVEPETDERFRDNPRNNKPILEIPVDHLEFRCAQDRRGECTNKEEVNKEINWSQTSNFKPDFDKLESKTISLLPVELDKMFGDSCYTPAGARVVDYELTDKNLDVRIERIFQVGEKCLSRLESLSDATVTVLYHYSFHKLSALASSDYEPVLYPQFDSNVFGFFDTTEHRLDVDYRDVQTGEVTYMNRWNPNRSEIVYYLSEEFSKPENAKLREATYVAFDRINNGLKSAGVKFRLVLKDGSGQKPGDISKNMIIMVEDPIASGVLGYGPSITNRRTGEIVSARTVMYPGVMRLFLRRTYENARLEREKKKALTQAKNEAKTPQAQKDPASTELQANNLGVWGRSVSPEIKAHLHSHRSSNHYMSTKVSVPVMGKVPGAVSNRGALSPARLKEIETELKDYTRHVAPTSSLEDQISLMSKHCLYPAEMVNFEAIVDESFDGAFGENLKPWDQMSEKERTSVVERLLPLVWIPTLIHEVGHNLGLRHNFQGSEDKDNWYTEEELARMGVKHIIPSSTVMEYPWDDLTSLPTLGKYDIAALRFGYARQVETAAGRLIPVGTTLKSLQTNEVGPLKDYGFCTDEHVGINAGCRRFDSGTSYTEIVDHIINQVYEGRYSQVNFRDGRRNFSLLGDAGYLGWVRRNFSDLRVMFEVYESIKGRFGLPEDAPEWEQVEFLKDLRTATDKVADFFLKVVKTPDVLCAISAANDPETILGVNPLAMMDPSAMSCDEIPLNPGYIMVGQAGKHFQSKKSSTSENPYLDQIDVRGVWIDKLLATQMLTMRVTGVTSFDRYTENLISYPGVQEKALQTFEDILFDQLSDDVEFKNEWGEARQIKVGYSLFSTHLIKDILDDRLRTYFGLPTQGNVAFIQTVLDRINQQYQQDLEDPSGLHLLESRKVLERFQVYRALPRDGSKLEDFTFVDVGATRYLARPQNRVALRAMESIHAVRIFGQLSDQQFNKIAEAISKGKEAPADATEVEKAAYQIPLSYFIEEANGLLHAEEYYVRLLNLLPTARN